MHNVERFHTCMPSHHTKECQFLQVNEHYFWVRRNSRNDPHLKQADHLERRTRKMDVRLLTPHKTRKSSLQRDKHQ